MKSCSLMMIQEMLEFKDHYVLFPSTSNVKISKKYLKIKLVKKEKF